MKYKCVDDFVDRHAKLLKIEYEEEQSIENSMLLSSSSKTLQRNGLAMLNLRLVSKKVLVSDKMLMDFVSHKGNDLSSTFLKRGDDIMVRKNKRVGDLSIFGVICRIKSDAVSITVRESHGINICGEDLYEVVKISDRTTYTRMLNTLKTLKTDNGHNKLIESLINIDCEWLSEKYCMDDISDTYLKQDDFYDSHLNEVQMKVVVESLRLKNLYLIHGPPGTGKTITISEIIKQTICPKTTFRTTDKHLARKKILVCGPSNTSVDNLLERLIQSKEPKMKICRLCNPARVKESLVGFTIDEQYKKSNMYEILDCIRKDIQKIQQQISKKQRKNVNELLCELRLLRKELRKREKDDLYKFIGTFDVVLTTCIGSGSSILKNHLGKVEFDLVVIDEAAQCLEAESFTPILLGKKLVLAGDHLQLPPVIISPHCANSELATTLFDRLIMEESSNRYTRLLSIQYRMNKKIMDFPSKQVYNGMLTADASVANRLLSDIAEGKTSILSQPLVLVDTTGDERCCEEVIEECHMQGTNKSNSLVRNSKFNSGEAHIVQDYIEVLRENGVKEKDIAVITPYSAQVTFLHNILNDSDFNVEIGTVDGFQGREKDVIILSLVRSNENDEIGFLSNVRRLNVAITRSKRQLFIVANVNTLRRSKFCRNLFEYLYRHGYAETSMLFDARTEIQDL